MQFITIFLASALCVPALRVGIAFMSRPRLSVTTAALRWASAPRVELNSSNETASYSRSNYFRGVFYG